MSRGLSQIADHASKLVADGPTESVQRRLQSGRVIATTEHDPPSARVEAVFDCAPERVWMLLNRYRELPKLIVGLDSATVLNRSDGEATVEFSMKFPFPIGRIVWVNRISSRRYGDAYGISWRLLSGNLVENSGRLVLARYEGDRNKTYANYLVQVQTRVPLPRAAQRFVTKWLLPRIVKRLRDVAEDPTMFPTTCRGRTRR